MTEVQSTAKRKTWWRLNGRQTKLLVGGLVVAVALVYLVFSAASEGAAYYVTIVELETQASLDRTVRVAGTVIGDSIVWNPRDLELTFQVADDGGVLPVTYKGPRPDMFQDGAEAVLEGKRLPDGSFEARTILLKCPSKYEGES